MVINEDTTFELIIIYISFGFTAYDPNQVTGYIKCNMMVNDNVMCNA